MFRALLFVQWRASRWVVFTAALAAFATPLLVLAPFGSRELGGVAPGALLEGAAAGAIALRFCAALAGMFLGITAWHADQQLGFTYALTRPVPRWYFVAMRFGGGVLMIAGIGAALALSTAVVALGWHLPERLHLYPVGLAARWVLATLVVFSAFFGLATVPSRGWARGFVWTWAGLLAVTVADLLLLQGRIVTLVGAALASPWSPLAIFGGRWFFIDV